MTNEIDERREQRRKALEAMVEAYKRPPPPEVVVVTSHDLNELDFKLAELLGLRPIQYIAAEVGKTTNDVYVGWKHTHTACEDTRGKHFRPTRDWNTLAPLMVAHNVFPYMEEPWDYRGLMSPTTDWSDFELPQAHLDADNKSDVEMATRVAIVKGLIAKLSKA